MAAKVARWRAGFAGSGLTAGDRVAVLLRNSVEWACFDVAALSLGLVTVPLHVTDGAYNWADQLADAEVRCGEHRLIDAGVAGRLQEVLLRAHQQPTRRLRRP